MSESALLPDFEVQATGNQRFQLAASWGHPFVRYDPPEDDTPRPTSAGQAIAPCRIAEVAVDPFTTNLPT
jgi:hypothetical protein